MPYRFIAFNDKKINSFLLLELEDLAKTLARSEEYRVDFRNLSYVSAKEKKIYISHFWDDRPEEIKKEGMKSDVFLRAFGNIHFTDFREVGMFLDFAGNTKIPGFSRQLLALAEDIRIEEECKRARPGMRRQFQTRRAVYMDYFRSQMTVNLEKNLYLDAFFNLIYLLWNTDKPIFDGHLPFNEDINNALPPILEKLEFVFEAKSTKDCASLCSKIIRMAEPLFHEDMINEYFHLPALDEKGIPDIKQDSSRPPALENSLAGPDEDGVQHIHQEEMETWHRETEKKRGNFFLFDLKRGAGSDLAGGNAKEGDPGQTEMNIIRGKSGKSNRRTETDLDVQGSKRKETAKTANRYGEANRNAKAVFVQGKKPEKEDIAQYKKLHKGIALLQRKLQNIMEETLEKKRTGPKTNRVFGRLGKNLLPFFTEEQPKLFYKKSEPVRDIDAVFCLLVDCSASMADKMTETKRGIILFHEALKSVRVPHEIIGFWEDGSEAAKDEQPNYFDRVISYPSSLQRESGPEIMRLKEQEDNRDGFAIRIAREGLLRRPEKQKFLIVFSDGEPSAFDYHQNGIVDTHQAVLEARKSGMEVFNIFLSHSGIDPGQEEVFKNMYGKGSIIANQADQLPDILFPLLKKLLYRAVNE